jgi:hypothetical protein
MDSRYSGGQLGGLGEKLIAGINPINQTTVNIFTGIGILFACIITFITFAVVPSKKVDPETNKMKSNMMFKLAITAAVGMLSFLICGGLGYHQGKRFAFCSANPKACAATTGASMVFDVFD